MSVKVYKGCVEALSWVVHFGDEKTGSTPILRRAAYYVPVLGQTVEIPFIAGNAVRGNLRRLVMRDMLDRVGYEVKSEKLYHALFAGGVLESTDESTGVLDLAFRRAVRSGIPPLGLFGASIGNQMVDSSLKVMHMIPVCAETAHNLPYELATDPRAEKSFRSFLGYIHHTRRDELRAEREADEQAVQMLVEFEAFVPGTLFYHKFALEYASELETACFGHVLGLWAEHPWVGGKSATGYGEIRFSYEPRPADPTPYLEYLDQCGDKVRALLAELEARLG